MINIAETERQMQYEKNNFIAIEKKAKEEYLKHHSRYSEIYNMYGPDSKEFNEWDATDRELYLRYRRVHGF